MEKLITSFSTFVRDWFGSDQFIPLHEPRFFGNEKKYVNECIDSTFVSSVGKFVDLFEQKMCELTGAKYCVATTNGTVALHMALKMAGVEKGDFVITSALTFVATANAVNYSGAEPIFCDVDPHNLGLCPNSLATFLKANVTMKDGAAYYKDTNRKVSACVPVHIFGHPCKIKEIVAVCDQYNMAVVEDSAESLGSYVGDQHTGTFGKVGIFSFNGNKTVTCGGGGAIVTDDEELAKWAKHVTTTAKVPHSWEYVHNELGYNYRLPNLNAALACAQLEQLKPFVENKRSLAQAYADLFACLSDVEFITEPDGTRSNYWLNAVKFKSKAERDEFLKLSNEAGLMTRPIWQLMHRLPMYEDCPKGDLTNAIALEGVVVNVPSSVAVCGSGDING
jgi:perosamine synthetase